MKKVILQNSLVWVLAIIVLGCSQRQKEQAEMRSSSVSGSVATEAAADLDEAKDAKQAAPEDYISSSAAVEKGDSNRKFIRKADIEFKTEDVIRSTYKIEDITVGHGGFVTNSSLQSSINGTEQINISKDSALLVTRYVMNAYLTLRVPNVRLDTTLKDIAQLVGFLNYRVITANDVALNIMANNLAQRRLTANEQRLTNAIDNRGRKLQETTDAEELLLRTQGNSDAAKISNLSLNDQVNFSTITIHLYGNQKTKKEMVERSLQYEQYEYKPTLGSRIVEGFKGGWDIFCTVIVAISYMWWLIVLVVGAIIAFRAYRKRKNSTD